MIQELYSYTEKFPKDFEQAFSFQENVCSCELFGYKWYFDVTEVENKTSEEIDLFEYLLSTIKKVEIGNKIVDNKETLGKILSRCNRFVINHLYDVVEKLKICYLYYLIQFTPFIYKQIDDGEGRIYWRVFKGLGFKDPNDLNFRKILSDRILLKWVLSNLVKDQEEEYEKLKSLQFFINPQFYREVYKEQQLSKELTKKVDAIHSLIKARKK